MYPGDTSSELHKLVLRQCGFFVLMRQTLDRDLDRYGVVTFFRTHFLALPHFVVFDIHQIDHLAVTK